jgi:hypothetical protein
MIPQVVSVKYQSRPDRRHRIWLPLLPIYLLLTPLLPLAIIALVIGCAHYRVNPLRILIALTRLLASLGGLHIDVAQGTTHVKIKLT